MNFDIAMPTTLFAVTVVAIFLNEKVERKLKAVFEEREFKVKDAVLLVAAISVAVSVITLVPQTAIMTIFLFAYSLLLFIFTYIFSDLKKVQAEIFCLAFIIIGFVGGTISLYFSISSDVYFAYGAVVLYCLCGFSFTVLVYEENRGHTKERWYLAVMPSIIFLTLYIFFNRTAIWFPYMLNLYGLLFAVLVILYFGGLFNWWASLLFAGLLTFADIILVLVTRSMVSAATRVSGLRLPVLVILPTFPQIVTSRGVLFMSLGLGDFFFAGLLAIQTYKKFGRKTALLSSAAMAISFLIFEAFILSFEIGAFPGTLMIISGWLPIMLLKSLKDRAIKASTGPPP